MNYLTKETKEEDKMSMANARRKVTKARKVLASLGIEKVEEQIDEDLCITLCSDDLNSTTYNVVFDALLEAGCGFFDFETYSRIQFYV